MKDRPDSMLLARQSDVRALVIVGELDRVTPIAEAMSLRSLLKGELVIVPDVGHLPNLEDPLAFNEALERLPRPRRLRAPGGLAGPVRPGARSGRHTPLTVGAVGRAPGMGTVGARVWLQRRDRPHPDRADAAAVAQMTATMSDRGPDGSGLWAQGPVALGHRRLKVIDLSERRPSRWSTASWASRSSSTAASTTTASCAASSRAPATGSSRPATPRCSLKAYHHWGDPFVDRLKGMFAFCLVERDSGRVLLGRDRPRHQAAVPGRGGALRWFASTLPALAGRRAAWTPRSIPWPCTST